MEAVFNNVFNDFVSNQLKSIISELCSVNDSKWDEIQTEITSSWESNLKKIKLGNKPPKDPNAPKKAGSAYNFFCKKNREQVKIDFPDILPKNIISQLAGMWKELKDTDPEAVKEYERLAAEDKQRYKDQVEKYVPDPNAIKVPKTKAKKDPSAPKSQRTAYVLYCNDHRANVKAENPEISFMEVNKILGAMWKNADDKEKEKYKKLSEQDKIRFEKEMESYVPGKVKAPAIADKPKKTMKKKDPDAPKKPKSAFMFYSQVHRSGVKEENPDLGIKEINAILKENWENCDNKEAYENMANEDKERYETEIKDKETASDEEPEPTDKDVRKIVKKLIDTQDGLTMKMIKAELKKLDIEIPKDELKKIVAEYTE